VTRPSAASPPVFAALVAIAAGGGAGALLRYELTRAIGARHGGFPVATLVINLVGSLLLGALVVAVTEVWTAHPLVRPALGTGVLGGFTTFSTFAVEVRASSAGVASGYLVATLAGGVAAAALGIWAMRRAVPSRVAGEADVIDPDLP
jgi:CrcB protein